MTYLIADSGSTKTSWVLTDGTMRKEQESVGINPVRDSEADVARVVEQLSIDGPAPNVVQFYGAGCIEPYSGVVQRVLQRRFPDAEIMVESDLLGAARALCGRSEGIACILGTGSNSCHYDGTRISANISPLGWILGDEGSGAVLGRRLVSDVLKGEFSPELCEAFTQETGLTRTTIINKVYREPMPNRWLASLVPFLGRHRSDTQVRQFLIDEFRRFLRRNVAKYQRLDLPVHFVGGIASSYQDELAEALRLEGMQLGRILKRPIDGIVEYLLH